MAVYDAACVPLPKGGHAGADPYAAPVPAGTEPEPRFSRSGVSSVTGCGRSRERVRALLEIQVRPEGPGAAAHVLRWRPRRRAAPSPGRGTPEDRILDRAAAGSS